jgi:hypothetical protein
MDLRQAVGIWRRRRILTSTLFVLAMLGVVAVQAKIPRYYQSASSSVVLASPDAAEPNGNNPFLSFSSSLTLTADAVSREMMSPATAGQLTRQGFTAAYTVTVPTYTTSTTGSILLVTVTGTKPAEVQSTLAAVNVQIGTQLAQMQHGLPARSQVRTKTLSITPQATLSLSQTARLPVAAAVLLLVLCLGAPIVVDGLVAQRRLRSGQRPGPREARSDREGAVIRRSPHAGQHSRSEPLVARPYPDLPDLPDSASAARNGLPTGSQE